jgi:hypothetical protein
MINMIAEAVSGTELREARLAVSNAITDAATARELETHVRFPGTLTESTRVILLRESAADGYNSEFRLVERNGGAPVYYFNIRWMEPSLS